MKENEVIYWEESPEVSHTIALITDCIHFIESKTYKNLLLVGIYDLDSNSFISYFNDYATFFARL